MLSGLWGSAEGEAGGGAQGQGPRGEEDRGLLGALSAGVWGLGEALVRSPPSSFCTRLLLCARCGHDPQSGTDPDELFCAQGLTEAEEEPPGRAAGRGEREEGDGRGGAAAVAGLGGAAVRRRAGAGGDKKED